MTARRLIAAGSRIDAGLAQINSENWDWLGLDAKTVFDPCANLAAAETVLFDAYLRPPFTLEAAISRYNSGDARRGVANGYVGRVKGWMTEPPPDRPYTAPAPDPSAEAPLSVRVRVDAGTHPSAHQADPRPRTPPWRFAPAIEGFGNG
jgi:type IV secretion system protein VirB1